MVRLFRGLITFWVLATLCNVVSAQTPTIVPKTAKHLLGAKKTVVRKKPALKRKVTSRRKKLTRRGELRVMAQASTYFQNYKLHLKGGNQVAAHKSLIKIIRMDPFPRARRARSFLAMIYVNLVDMLISQKKFKKAWNYANQGMKRTVRNSSKYPSLAAGELFKMMGRIKAAQGDSRKAVFFNEKATQIFKRLEH